MSASTSFSYDLAFDRNLGWVTEAEQLALRGKRVAIAGMGGVGGVHLLTLTRLGIGSFHIADFDRFDLPNFNRQIGATMHTLGLPKAAVLDEMAHDINPELRLKRFDTGVDTENLDAFLDGVDLFVDGFDFFVLDIRRHVFARCRELGIPAITAAPIGMGTAFLTFIPGGMSFEKYFRLNGHSEQEQYLRFLVGLTPKGLHRSYLVDPSRLDLAARKGPSTAAACQLCAGVAAVTALKLLLRRGDVKPAPYHHHFDAYRGQLVTTKLSLGNAGPMQRTRLALARRALSGAQPPTSSPASISSQARPSRRSSMPRAGRRAATTNNRGGSRFGTKIASSFIWHLTRPTTCTNTGWANPCCLPPACCSKTSALLPLRTADRWIGASQGARPHHGLLSVFPRPIPRDPIRSTHLLLSARSTAGHIAFARSLLPRSRLSKPLSAMNS